MKTTFVGAFILVSTLFLSIASAQTTGNVCVRDFRSGAVCTANDVRIEDLVPVTVVEDCNTGTVGETIVQFEALVSSNGSPDRYDIGLYLALDGGSARDGDMCFHDYLEPPLTGTPVYGDKNMDGVDDVDGGPWWDGDTDADTCGDIESNTQVFKDLQQLTFACSDNNLDGSVDVSVCTSWDNNTGTMCASDADAFPGTNSKCSCGSIELGIPPVYLTVTKTADQATVISGDTATFTITAPNTGIEDIQNVMLDDAQCDSISAVMGDDGDNVLETTETWSWTCTINNVTMDLTNTATVTGTTVTTASAVSASDSDSVTVTNPSVALTKSGVFNDESGDGIAQAGETISYAFEVTNSGDTALSNISVTDPMVSPITCPSGNPIPSLAVGASETCTGTYTLTQADVDNGQKDNTATASGEDPGGNPVSDMDSETTALPAAPALGLAKSGVFNDESGDGIAQAGETISYTFQVSNTGNQTLTNVGVTDPQVSPITCPSGNPIPSLAVGASETCTGTYTLIQADVDAGQKDNTATADSDQAGPTTDSNTVPLPGSAALSLAKSGVFNDESGDGIAQAGETISYTFQVSNTGNQTLTNISVTDPQVSPITCPSGNPIGSLGVGASETCTGTYVLTQADVDAGQKDNTATANSDQAGPTSDSNTVPLPGSAALSLAKSGVFNDESGDGIAQAGETISYTFQVSNTGNQTLTNISVTDPQVSPITCPSGNPIPSLAVGASETCTGTYTLTQADVDNGQKDNTATADSDQAGPTTDSNTVPLPGSAALSLVKSGSFNDESGDGIAQAGETISYTFQVSNTGNQTLTNISVTDPQVSPITCPSGNPIPSLAVGASETCTGTYTLTQADVDNGQKDNTATADSDQAGPTTDSNTVPLPGSAALSLVKSGSFNDESGDGLAQVGETISYAFQVTNTGNRTLTNVAVTDPMVSPITCPGSNPIPSLAVGASETCTGAYVLTQADIDNGQKDNTATADSDQTGPTSDSATVPMPGSAALSLTKSGAFSDESSDGIAQAGETISYSFLVENVGNQTLTSVKVTDPMVSPITCPSGNPIGTLAVGADETCSGTYTLTQADIDAGQKDNTATADSDQTGPTSDSNTVPLPGNAALSLIKSGAFNDESADGIAQAGETITYSFEVTNSGSQTLTNVGISDPAVSPVTCPSGNPIGSLAVGATQTCTGVYTVTQADVDAGQKDNTATADSDQTGPTSDSTTVPLPSGAALSLAKSGTFNDESSDGIAQAGETIAYIFEVTNTGNQTLTNVSVTDPLVSTITCPGSNPIPSLAVGAGETCTGSYAVTQADVDAGQRDNTATADSDQTAPVSDSASVPLPAGAALSLTKSGAFNDENGDGNAQVGETIAYTFEVANTGSQTLTNVGVTDPIVAAITCPSGNPIPSLAVGVGETCTGSYAVTQADVDTGQRDNTATADSDQTAPVSDSATVPLTAGAALSLTKSGAFNDENGDGNAQVGETIAYTFEVANTGSQTLTNVGVTDPIVATITCPSGNPIPSLAVGVGETCTGSYAVTQADVDTGQRDNTATAEGTDAGGNPVSDSDTALTPLPQGGGLPPDVGLTKASAFSGDSNASGVLDAGDELTYTVVFTNRGPVEALAVRLTDTPDPNTALVAGSVTTTQGTVASGNSAGDTSVTVDIGDVAVDASATVSFRVTINEPLPPDIDMIVNQAVASGDNFEDVASDDPSTAPEGDPTTDDITRGQAEAIPVPTLSPLGIAVLVLLFMLTGIGLRVSRKRR